MNEKEAAEKVEAIDAVPIAVAPLGDVYTKPFQSLMLANFITEKVIRRALDCVYSKELEKKLMPYTILGITRLFQDLFMLHEVKGDWGENLPSSDTAVKKGLPKHEWQFSLEPVTQNSVNSFRLPKKLIRVAEGRLMSRRI